MGDYVVAGGPEGAFGAVLHAVVEGADDLVLEVTDTRRLLEDGHEPPKQVAARCGFVDTDTRRLPSSASSA